MNEEPFISNDQLTGQLFKKFLLPSILALLASNLSSMIDTIIIGNAISEKGLAAMSLVAPISMIYFTAGSLTAVGSSIMAGIALGENKPEKAGGFFSLSFLIAGAFTLLFTVFGLSCLKWLPTWLGADQEQAVLVKNYCLYYISGGFAPIFFYIPFNFLKLMGKPKASMLLLFIMAAVNVTLTLLFVYVFHMETEGAALATVISFALAFFIGCLFMFSRKRELRLSKPEFSKKAISGVFSSGSAAAFNNLSRSIIIILMNLIIVYLSSGRGLSIYAVSRNINDLFTAVILGISQSVVPLVSLFYGEKDNEHIRMVIKKAVKKGSIIVGLCAASILIFSGKWIRLFGITNSTGFGREGYFALFCVAAALNLSFLNTLFLNYYSAIRKTILSNLILICRIVFLTLGTYLAGRLFGAFYIWIGFISAELLTLLFWPVFTGWYWKRAGKQRVGRLWLLDRENEDLKKSLNFSVKGTQEDILEASERIGWFCRKRGLSENQGMVISLSVEELLILLSDKCFKERETSCFDLRLFISENEVLLRIRCFGKPFNPVDYYEKSEDELSDSLGVGMIRKSARLLQYSGMFGMNNLLILV